MNIQRTLRSALLAAALHLAAGASHACGPGGSGQMCPAPDPAPASLPASGAVSLAVGNPINVISGNKYQQETDMPALPGVLGLEIVRHYNSFLSGSNSTPGITGRGWKLSYETQLYAFDGTLQIMQADGSRLIFSRDLLNPSLCASADPAHGRVEIKGVRGKEEYLWTWNDGRTLRFDRDGRLTQIQAPTGEVLSLLYNQGLLVKVTDPQGRSLRLAYLDREGVARGERYRGVQSIASPVGRFVYEYGSAAPQGATVGKVALAANLVRVQYPVPEGAAQRAAGGPAARRYHYEDALRPTYLTGVSVEAQDAAGKNASQRYATFGYDINGKAVLSTHAGNADKVTLDFSQGGQTVITNSAGEKTVYRHAIVAGEFRLLEVRGAGCALCGPANQRYGYDKQGRLVETSELDAQGAVRRTDKTELDFYGRPLRISRIEYKNGRALAPQWLQRYEYATEAPLPSVVARPSVVAGREASARMSYNGKGQLLSMTEQGWAPAPDGKGEPQPIVRTTSYGYRTVNGRSVLALVDGPLPNGKAGTPADSDITLLDYDSQGRMIERITAPGGVVTEVVQRDEALRPVTVKASDGYRLVRSEAQLLHGGQLAALTERAWLLDKKGQPDAGSVQADGAAYRYDGQGRVGAAAVPDGGIARYVFDGGDNLTHVVAPDQGQRVRTFDTEGRLLAAVQYSAGAPIALAGQDDAQRVPLAGSYRRGAPGSVAEALVESVSRPGGSEVRRWLDDFGRVVAILTPESGLRTAAYAADGSLRKLAFADGRTVSVERDAQGRALRVVYFDAAGRHQDSLTYQYQGVALAGEARYAQQQLASQVDWQPDAWGRPSRKRLAVYGAGTEPSALLEVGYARDAQGRVVRKTMPGGAVLDYAYDAAGGVTAISIGGKPIVSGVRYTAAQDGARLAGYVYGNGLAARSSYDGLGRLTLHESGTRQRILRADADKNTTLVEQRLAVTRAPQPERLSLRLPQLFSTATAADVAEPAATSSVPHQYRYDEYDRLVAESSGERQLLDLRYNALGDRLGLPAPSTDAVGNVLEHGKHTLDYNAAGELAEVRSADGKLVARYGYDAEGIRVVKRAGGRTSYFLYEDGQLLAEADGEGRVVAEYVYLGRKPVARLLSEPGAMRGIARWLPKVFAAGPEVEYLHPDQRDAVESVTDANGALRWQAELGPFGDLRQEGGPRGQMPLRLSGQYADPETGLYYNVHRYYDAATGRYLQPDPLGIEAGLNLYAYAEGDPLRKTDPLGLSIEPDSGWGGGVAPWLFGTAVHSQMAAQIRGNGLGWGANDGRNGTWVGLRPDAYYVKPTDLFKPSFHGTLWELKPISWSSAVNPANYAAGKGEVAAYIAGAKKGCWTAGSSKAIVSQLTPTAVLMGGKVWNVTFQADAVNDQSGLLFYSKQQAQEKPVPQQVPAPALSPSQRNELDKQMQQIKAQGAKEGWSTLETIGMVVLIGLAIALLVAAAILLAPAIAAVLASIAAALSAAAAGTVALMAALAALFAFSPAVAAEATKKGEEKQKGMLDGAIDWFKGWF
ncbi:RHS repeat-associated core domain-containing protein [Pseudoduganella aquatica]|uniref:RHS repeat-associated core domain-containing protein n=1 Tax=Pseudoduganella aquatica TaxID=2660641 RepID=UPI001E5C78B3|nr:RHS repeat-associated core domain-containing protein [Pseudoduganella aquatica]